MLTTPFIAFSYSIPRQATILSDKCCVPLLVKARPNCARQSLARTVSALAVAATSYCHPGRNTNVVVTQWNPKYGCKGTVTTCFALIGLPKYS